MAGAVDVANRALSKLGAERITALDDDTKGARAMLARFDLLRDAEMAAHPWRFAIHRVELAALADAPVYGYALQYQRPSDDLRPVMVGDHPIDWRAVGVMFRAGTSGASDAAFEIIGDTIQSDMPAPLKYEYVRRVENTGLWPALFVEALACRLAWDAAEELTQSAGKYDRAEAQYKDAIKEARRVNALWRPPHRREAGRWMTSRVGW